MNLFETFSLQVKCQIDFDKFSINFRVEKKSFTNKFSIQQIWPEHLQRAKKV